MLNIGVDFLKELGAIKPVNGVCGEPKNDVLLYNASTMYISPKKQCYLYNKVV